LKQYGDSLLKEHQQVNTKTKFDCLYLNFIEIVNGKIITEIDGVLEVWRKYCKNLYKEDVGPEEELKQLKQLPSIKDVSQKLDILKGKIQRAICYLKNNRSTGKDIINAKTA